MIRNILKNKRLYIHIGAAIVLGMIILFITFFSLDSLTRHGEKISVPDFTGYSLYEVEDQVEFSKFEFTIIDSIYDAQREKGSIVSQEPKPESMVKEGRNIYLTVVAINPEMVKVPNLIDLSLRNAKSILETYGIKISKLSYVPDIAKNAVVEVKFMGEEIYEGAEIIKGSSIELVLGLGAQKQLIKVPLLIGLTRKEAEMELHLASLNIGEEHFEEGDDSTTVKVYRQVPNYSRKAKVKMGQSIELYYKSDKNFDFEQYLKTIRPSNSITDSLIDAEESNMEGVIE